MFTIDPDPKFTHVVKVRVPVDGGFAEQSFKATFRVIPAEEAATYDLSTGADSAAFLRRAIVSMDELVGADGQTTVPYSDALRDQLLAVSYVRSALGRTYFEAVAGAPLGN